MGVAEGTETGVLDGLDVETGVETGVVEGLAGDDGDVGAAPPPGTWVGTVEGWRAVFQVAVVGQGVVATVGDVVA